MNKLPTKQIYLLSIAIFGIIAISIYSTYAIFTLESKSDNIVSIRTPDTLNISSSSYEYKQISIPKNAYITTDIDLYNNLDFELCYSVWYKALNNVDSSKLKIYENTTSSLTTSSTISAITSKRINLIIINDTDSDAKVNIGVAFSNNDGSCELNISQDKTLITSTIDAKSLSDTLIKNTNITNKETNYLTYKDNTEEIILSKDKTYYVSNEFTYKDELFTLKNPKKFPVSEISDYQNYYLCEDNETCKQLYHINEMSTNTDDYIISKYDILVGYLAGENGLRKINNDYYFYGDNPNNFIYYNCSNELDTKTCELWRIIGFKYDEKNDKYLTKIIRNDYLDSLTFDANKNIWNNSNIYKYLNEEYKLKSDGMIEEYPFKEENIVSIDTDLNNLTYLEEENKSKVTIINLSDYLYASVCKKDKITEYDSSCFNNNWLNKDVNEWTMTTKFEKPYINEETNETITPDNNIVYSVNSNVLESNITNELNVRPVIYLKSRVLLTNGDGTLDNPYIIR